MEDQRGLENHKSEKNPAIYPASSVRSPLSAYDWFVQLTKKDHFRRNPHLQGSPKAEESVEADCSARWPSMSPTARKQFTSLETVDVSRYNFQIRKAIDQAHAEKAKREKVKSTFGRHDALFPEMIYQIVEF